MRKDLDPPVSFAQLWQSMLDRELRNMPPHLLHQCFYVAKLVHNRLYEIAHAEKS